MPPKRTKAAIEKTKISKKDTVEVPSEEPVKKQARSKMQKETTEAEAPAEPAKKQGRAKPQKENGTSEESEIEAPMKKERKAKKEKHEPESMPLEEAPPAKKQRAAKAASKRESLDAAPQRPARAKAPKAVQNDEPEKVIAKKKVTKKDEAEKPVEKPKAKGKKAAVEENPKKAAKSKKPAVKEAKSEGGLSNITDTKWDEIDFGCKTTTPNGEKYNLKITSWNVDGLRAWFKKGGWNIMEFDKPDIFCLQETKCSEEKLPEEMASLDGYHAYWCSSTKEGYAGVGVYSKIKPVDVKYGIGDEKHDDDGRCLTLEFEKFYLVNVYVPNAGRGLVTLPKRLDWNEVFKTYITGLDKTKPVIVCGDMNVAHEEIDIANPKSNKKNAGFTQEEREGMTDFLSCAFVDTFRELHPEEKDVYTFWSYMAKARSKNIGWRLDYFITSNRLMKNICDSVVRNLAFGSDHCPITLFLNI